MRDTCCFQQKCTVLSEHFVYPIWWPLHSHDQRWWPKANPEVWQENIGTPAINEHLLGGAITILKNMSSSTGRMTSHILWNKKMFQTTSQTSSFCHFEKQHKSVSAEMFWGNLENHHVIIAIPHPKKPSQKGPHGTDVSTSCSAPEKCPHPWSPFGGDWDSRATYPDPRSRCPAPSPRGRHYHC